MLCFVLKILVCRELLTSRYLYICASIACVTACVFFFSLSLSLSLSISLSIYFCFALCFCVFGGWGESAYYIKISI